MSDPTLDLDLAAVTGESRRLAAAIKPGTAAPFVSGGTQNTTT